MKGDVAQALTELREQYDSGADPAVVIADLAEFTHLVTKLKIIPETADDPALVEAERVRGRDFAKALSMRVLARAWQMLTKGLTEVQQAAKPMQAAEMVLVRLAYASDLPTPDEALRRLREGRASRPGARRMEIRTAVQPAVAAVPPAQLQPIPAGPARRPPWPPARSPQPRLPRLRPARRAISPSPRAASRAPLPRPPPRRSRRRAWPSPPSRNWWRWRRRSATCG